MILIKLYINHGCGSYLTSDTGKCGSLGIKRRRLPREAPGLARQFLPLKQKQISVSKTQLLFRALKNQAISVRIAVCRAC